MDKWNKPIFNSQGHIEPWGRDFWTENKLGEFIIVIGIPFLIGVIIIGTALVLLGKIT